MPSSGGTLRLRSLHIEGVRHPAELGKRTRLHLPHQVGAMHLHRGFGDADIVGDLLVQATGHDMEHDVTLAGAERVVTFLERGQRPFTLPTGTIASEAGLNGVKQILIAERLCEELYSAALHCLHSHRYVPVRSSKIALKLKTASPRHSDVEYEASRPLRRIGLEKIGNRRKLTGMQPDRPQQPRNRIAKLGIVIDEQNSWICVTHPRHPALGKKRIPPPETPSFYGQSVKMNSIYCISG